MARVGRVLTKPETTKTKLTQAHSKLQTAIVTVETAHRLYNAAKEWRNRRSLYVVKISEKDSIFPDVQDWLMHETAGDDHRVLLAASSNKKDGGMVSDDSGEETDSSQLKFTFADGGTREVHIEGHKIEVSLVAPDLGDKSEAYLMRYDPAYELMFRSRSKAGQDAVRRLLERINASHRTARKPKLKMMNQWSQWSTRNDLPARTMDSVSLPKEQKERIIADLGDFLKSEEKYNRLAIPWHRGYMFYGPPGTGKTSLVKALANEFKLDLWYISLSDFKSETGLISMISQVSPRSILLLEDIDTIKITHDRDAADSGAISMSSLLNTLDGVATPHGLVTVMTTNRFDILDPALTRAGRMDLVEELGYPTQDTIKDLFRHFYGVELVFKREESWMNKVSTSQIAEIFKHNFENPEKARAELVELLFIKGH